MSVGRPWLVHAHVHTNSTAPPFAFWRRDTAIIRRWDPREDRAVPDAAGAVAGGCFCRSVVL